MDRLQTQDHSEVTRRTGKLTDDNCCCSTQFDPVKVWVILHYPDSLKVSPCTLRTLLDNLKSCPAAGLGMKQFEWTLSARVNCKDTDKPEASEGCRAEDDFPVVTDYFCITAPVDLDHPNDDNSCPHYVSMYTETVIVDLRYKPQKQICIADLNECKCGNDVLALFDKIAECVRTIVIDTLGIKDQGKKYRVYVLKPQDQTSRGVSPRCSRVQLDSDDLVPIPPLEIPSVCPDDKMSN